MKYIYFMTLFISFNLFSNNLLVEGSIPMESKMIFPKRILKIARIGNPILRQVASDVTDFSSVELKKIIKDLKDTFEDFQGTAVGLAAPQVNISLKIILIQVPEVEKTNYQGIPLTVMINPTYSNITDEIVSDYEGCLSIPGLMGMVPRYKDISYSYQDEDGKIIKQEAHGFFARLNPPHK